MNTIAATFLLPVGVAVYTFVGGIKATFLTDYMHTTVILIILCYFTVQTFMIDEISSIGKIYDLVVAATNKNPISGAEAGKSVPVSAD
jgi:urea-proton symporter